ncbi:S1C family serine protease [Cellulomonas phragmiteti]|uniref:S1C family serine protease n=1 Tax=Cellulomonas phragmiteti TaxID=478780 RepID=UPI0019445109|nr:trypsin-like peptidase domain-containing protein [Cellulomonas phragmiteti]
MPLPGGPGTTAPGAASTGTQETLAATAEQQTGVVMVVSTLGYEGAASAGTGMVLTSDGLVLTNHHVVEGATAVEVTVGTTGRTYTASVVGYDADADVALLQLAHATGLDTVTLDDDDGVVAGDEVTAVGNADGAGELVAAPGTVLATGQSMTASDGTSAQRLDGLVEFEADVVPGDSGGALLDAEGEVVGMTTAASTGGTYVVAYAVDIVDALAVVQHIEAGDDTGGVVIGSPAFLGVQVAVGGQVGSETGAVLGGVVAGTPAAQAGLAAGDTVTSVRGVPVASPDELGAAVASYRPGDEVEVLWVDGTTGATRSAMVTLAQGPVG